MITKAYIQEVLSPHRVRVRIPLYHMIENVNGSVPSTLLPIATMAIQPNAKVLPEVGDVVIVAFEEDDLSSPIVIGYLYSPNECLSKLDIDCSSIIVGGDATLSSSTVIGDISYDNIECLKNQRDNIADALFKISSDIDNLNRRLNELEYKL